MTDRSLIALFLIFAMVSIATAQSAVLTLSMEDYIKLAVQQGIKGQENALELEAAGYSRRIAFRQTDSPTLTAAYSNSHAETRILNGGVSSASELVITDSGTVLGDTGLITNAGTDSYTVSDQHQYSLTLNQPLPTGTAVTVQGLLSQSAYPGFSASVSQPVYLFVKNPFLRTRSRAALNYASAKDSFQAGILAIRTQARNFYYDVLLGDESIRVERRKTDSSRKLLDVTQALVEAGKLAPVETMRAKIRMQAAERILDNVMVERNKAILNAKSYVYLPLDQPVVFSSKLTFKPFGLGVKQVTDYALLHRPELINLRRARDLTRLDVDIAKEAARPLLSVNSGYDYNKLDPLTTKTWSIGGNASWQFFDSFVTRDQVRQARIAEKVAGLNLAEMERSTLLEVENAYLDVKKAEKQIDDFQNSREQAARNVEILRLRFQNGLERLIDVFDAENDMRNLDNEYLGLLIGYNRAIDNLAHVVGTDLENIR